MDIAFPQSCRVTTWPWAYVTSDPSLTIRSPRKKTSVSLAGMLQPSKGV
jgi:hypothetical protein